ncbi:peptidoglycan-binding domain-containing protein [Tessaracoccus coleopterorum]|uniref:peptidoglycan-binding domain-containing protein n=1 Tax=Tessaracoccus coleopterorum TaxID=2714950 RepID=UPI002F906A47
MQTLQSLLNAVNSAGITADGVYGAKTKTAVIAFQKKQGLSGTGLMDDKTWGKLVPALRQGANGGAVTALQTELKAAGQAVTVNGTFDAATRKAVSAFQTVHRIKVTGEVDALTWARLIGD